VRPSEHGLRTGEHGLPLIGSGDWNDGMNRVGIKGRGESVWLGFFLYEVLRSSPSWHASAATRHSPRAAWSKAKRLRENLEQHGWDGAWYRRAYFDDGTPLGSADNSPNAGSTRSPRAGRCCPGAGEPERARRPWRRWMNTWCAATPA
jgi:cyclic beta-1,2-glucan synthetase